MQVFKGSFLIEFQGLLDNSSSYVYETMRSVRVYYLTTAAPGIGKEDQRGASV